MLDLEAIELIKQLKSRYFRFLDTGNLEEMASVFTHDATAHFKGGSYEFALNGWTEICEFYRQSFTATKFGMHQGHHPEISVEGNTASGIWYLQDFFYNLEDNTVLMGSALYRDSYVKVDGHWKINHTGYERLFEERTKRSPDARILVKPIN